MRNRVLLFTWIKCVLMRQNIRTAKPDQILLVCIEGIVAFVQDLANALLHLLIQKLLPCLAVHGDLGIESG